MPYHFVCPICHTEFTAAHSNRQFCSRACRAKVQRRVSYTVDEASGCWIWNGSLKPDGYGRFMLHGRQVVAHRYFWEQLFGPVPAGHFLHHVCYNPSCVNPSHLELVTPKEHSHKPSHCSKLSATDVAEIRRLCGQVSQGKLARQFGVDQGHISAILHGRRW